MKKVFLCAMFSIMCTISAYAVKDTLPSEWARAEIEQADTLSLIPDIWSDSWTTATSREEFCELACCLLDAKGFDWDDVDWQDVSFADSQIESVRKLKALGIVQGIDANGMYFSPNTPITRQEAAKLLYALARTKVFPPIDHKALLPHVWNDRNLPAKYLANGVESCYLAPWAREAADFCYNSEILTGVGENCLAPNSPYTKEESAVTMLRLYKYSQNPEIQTDIRLRYAYPDHCEWKDADGNLIVTLPCSENDGYHFGYTIATITGKNGYEFEDRRKIYDLNGQQVATNNPWNGEFQFVKIVAPNTAFVWNERNQYAAMLSLPDGAILRESLGTVQHTYDTSLIYSTGQDNVRYGVISETGVIQLEPIYEWAGGFKNGVAFVKKPNESPMLIDESGNIVSTAYAAPQMGWEFGEALGTHIIYQGTDGTSSIVAEMVLDFYSNLIVPPCDRVDVTRDGYYYAYRLSNRTNVEDQGLFYTNTGVHTMTVYGQLAHEALFACSGRCIAYPELDGKAYLYDRQGAVVADIDAGDSLLQLCNDGGSVMAYVTQNKTGGWEARVIDDQGILLSQFDDVQSIGFVDGLLKVQKPDGSEAYYTPLGKKI